MIIEYTVGVLESMEAQFWDFFNGALYGEIEIGDSQPSEPSETELSEGENANEIQDSDDALDLSKCANTQ